MNANDIITITLSAEDWALLRAIAEKDKAKQECEKLAHVGIHAEIEENPLFNNPYVEPQWRKGAQS